MVASSTPDLIEAKLSAGSSPYDINFFEKPWQNAETIFSPQDVTATPLEIVYKNFLYVNTDSSQAQLSLV